MIALLNTQQAAERLLLSRAAVRQAALRGRLPALHLGRTVRVALEPVPHQLAELQRLLTRLSYGVGDLASAWGVHRDTIQRLARARVIPMTRRQGHWIISRARLACWLGEQLWRAP